MDSFKAKALAVELMTKHNLVGNGWKFAFDNSKRRLGCCKFRIKTITFSKNYVPLVDLVEYTDTILHEIAHALVGHGHGHDMVWKRKALEIGCNGKRLYQGEKRVEGKYVANCPCCSRTFYKHRMSVNTKESSCGFCSGGRFNRKYLLIFKEVQ